MWVQLLTVPYRLLFPAILRVLLHRRLHRQQQASSTSTRWPCFGLLGYVLLKLDCEPAPLMLGFILGPMMEENLRRAMLLSRGDPLVFVTRSRSASASCSPPRAAGDHRAAGAAHQARGGVRGRDLGVSCGGYWPLPSLRLRPARPGRRLGRRRGQPGRFRLVAPYAAGGPIDISARLLAARLQESLGQPVVVENRPGAGGNIGVDLIAKGPADGYNLVMSAIATLAINPSLYPGLPYDPLKDLRHVTLLVQVPNVLIVANDLPAKSVKELVALARERPGKLDFGLGSTGSERPRCRGDVQGGDRHLHGAHSIQRLCPRARRSDGRAGEPDVRQSRQRAAEHQIGEGAPAGSRP